MSAPPASVRSAMIVIYVMIAFQVLGAVLRAAAPELFLVDIADQTVEPPNPTTSIVLGLIMIGLFVYFALSFQKGASWARTTLVVLTGILLIFSVFGVLTTLLFGGIPPMAIAMNVIQLVLLWALLRYLLKPDTYAWCHRRPKSK